jgi:hypothetical protein
MDENVSVSGDPVSAVAGAVGEVAGAVKQVGADEQTSAELNNTAEQLTAAEATQLQQMIDQVLADQAAAQAGDQAAVARCRARLTGGAV